MHPVHPRLVNQPLPDSQRHQARFSQAGQRAGLGLFFGSLWPASTHTAHRAGASAAAGGVGWVQARGQAVRFRHAFTFVPLRPVHQPVQGLFFPMEAPMGQLDLPLMGRIDAPSVVPPALIRGCTTYRQAVRLCWTLRRAKGLTISDLARDFSFNRQHASDYLNPDDAPTRRSLPGERVQDFEDACGNAAISQWHNMRAHLTTLEELQAERAAA